MLDALKWLWLELLLLPVVVFVCRLLPPGVECASSPSLEEQKEQEEEEEEEW